METILIFFLLWALFCFYLIGSYLRKRRRARVSQGWAYCQGTVDSSMVHEEVNREESGSAIHYFPVVNYSYRVRGTMYQNDKISFSLKGEYRSSKKAEKITQKYAQGRAVTVYYDPDDPATAVLDRSVPISGLIWGIILAILWMVGVIGFISALPN